MDKIRTKFDKPLKYKKSEWNTDTEGGAMYFVKGKKRPVAYSTIAELESLSLLGEENSLLYIADMYNNSELILSQTEKQVLEVLISYGKITLDYN
jgi:hypothetical protein